MPKTFNITQLHTFEYVYEIQANSKEDALLKLHQMANEPISEEFHSINDREDWIVEDITDQAVESCSWCFVFVQPKGTDYCTNEQCQYFRKPLASIPKGNYINAN